MAFLQPGQKGLTRESTSKAGDACIFLSSNANAPPLSRPVIALSPPRHVMPALFVRMREHLVTHVVERSPGFEGLHSLRGGVKVLLARFDQDTGPSHPTSGSALCSPFRFPRVIWVDPLDELSSFRLASDHVSASRYGRCGLSSNDVTSNAAGTARECCPLIFTSSFCMVILCLWASASTVFCIRREISASSSEPAQPHRAFEDAHPRCFGLLDRRRNGSFDQWSVERRRLRIIPAAPTFRSAGVLMRFSGLCVTLYNGECAYWKVDARRGGESSVYLYSYVRRYSSRRLLGTIPSEPPEWRAALVVGCTVLALSLDFDNTGKRLASANARTAIRLDASYCLGYSFAACTYMHTSTTETLLPPSVVDISAWTRGFFRVRVLIFDEFHSSGPTGTPWTTVQ
ncbi:hypothetical protein R3P38DRAFT_2776712 [Favolaschia claudopus]|uniref:Uncharacterized protein n=1 Tax=Favolaschia claudopus TaxID=2862362 RepID=A0AAW0BQ43_9AGAR